MPRAKSVPSSAARQRHESLWYDNFGSPPENHLTSWDPDASRFFEAIAAIAASGATSVIRPGSGGRSLGIAIWEGDDRHPPIWFHEHEELDAWTARILERAEAIKQKQSGENGA